MAPHGEQARGRQVVGESGGDHGLDQNRTKFGLVCAIWTMVRNAGRHQHLVDDVDHAVAGCDVGEA